MGRREAPRREGLGSRGGSRSPVNDADLQLQIPIIEGHLPNLPTVDPMNIPIPTAKDLLAEIPLHCVIHPLERPRLNFMSKRVYQPLDNQKELLAEMALYAGAYIYVPVFVETMIVHTGPGEEACVAKPWGDLDNQVKGIHDALVKAHIILDDRLIVACQASRAYGAHDFCLVRIWSVSPTTETFPWDLSTARIRSKQPKPPEEHWPTPTPPSKSSRRARAKPKS